MNREIAYIVMFCLGGGLFALGGTGYKWTRVFLLPIVLGIVAFVSHVLWWKILATLLTSIVAFSLPYGEKHPLWLRIATGLSFGICLLPLRISPVVLIPSVVFLGLYYLSRKFNSFTWKWVELFTGAVWGMTAVSLF